MRRARRVQHDDAERFYSAHVEGVYAFLAFSVDDATAEDLTAATFERALRAWRKYDPAKGSERTWLLAIARNLLTDHYRTRRHREAVSTEAHPLLLDLLSEDRDPLAEVLSAQELSRWLAPLGDRERQVLALRYAADLSTSEIASVMDLTTANVQQIISRSLRRLRTIAEARGSAAGP